MNINIKSNIDKFKVNNQFIYNNISLTELAINKQNLTIKEFINKIEFKIENMYIDKFWNSINDETKWILLDDEIIRWLTNNKLSKIFNCRKTIKDKIMNNKRMKYKIISYIEVLEISNTYNFEVIRISDKKQMKYMLIHPDSFKKLCMMCNTEKGDDIREYYIQLEKIFKMYIKYQYLSSRYNNIIKNMKYKQKEIEYKQKEIEYKQKEIEYNNKIINMQQSINYCNKEISDLKKLKSKNDFIYISTNKTYATQGLYKIGITKNINSRLQTLNTSHPIKDKMIIIKSYNVYDSKIAEDRIKYILDSLRDYKYREYYKGIYCLLDEIIKLICDNLENECEKINEIIDKLIKINSFEDGYMLNWTKGLDMKIFETDKVLLSKNIETNELKISDDITENDIKIILLKYFNKYGGNTFDTFDALNNSIKKYRLIKKNKILTIDNVTENIFKYMIECIKEKKWKFKFKNN